MLALKSVIFGLLLAFTPPPVFVAGSFFLYAKPLFRTFEMIEPFLILLAVALLSSQFTASVIYFSFLFYLILGVKDLVFIKREEWNRVLNLGLIYPAFLLFFYYNQDFFIAKSILVFLAALFLLKGLLKIKVVYWFASFLVLEAVWAISLLPIGYINLANLAALVYFILTDLILRHLAGTLTKKRILTDVSIFAILLILILALSKWGL